MPRTLRARKEINYAQLISFDDDDPIAGGPATASGSGSAARPSVPIEDEVSSGSDFDAGKDDDEQDELDDESSLSALPSEYEDEDTKMRAPEDEDEDEDDGGTAPKGKKRTGLSNTRSSASVARSIAQKSVVQLAPGLSRVSKRQMHARPLPSVHHRHRFVPLMHRTLPAERLVSAPYPGIPEPEVAKTRSGTENERMLDRTGRGIGYNVGPGPVWEMIEDRAWFKESDLVEGEEWMESRRRPKVYEDLKADAGFEVLEFE
jgi:transcription factor C subunit 6